MASQWGPTEKPRRKLAVLAHLEALEGRQLMAANAAQVGFQEDASTGTNTLIITGTNKADVIRIDDNGTGAAGAITVTLGTGIGYTTKSASKQSDVVARTRCALQPPEQKTSAEPRTPSWSKSAASATSRTGRG